MDKNTITGLLLIFAILIGFHFFTKPSAEEIALQHSRDSIARVENIMNQAASLQREVDMVEAKKALVKSSGFLQDSLEDRTITLENNKIKLQLSTLGGRISFVDLKEYRTHDSLDLVLWNKEISRLNLNFYAYNKEVNTEDFLFSPSVNELRVDASQKEQVVSMRLYADSLRTKYLEYQYTLSPNSYKVGFNIITKGLNDIIATSSSFLTLNWAIDMPQLEKSKDFEKRYTGVYYKFQNDDVENLSSSSDSDQETLSTKVEWISYKQQFFSSILIPEEPFNDVNLSVATSEKYSSLKLASSEIPLVYSGDDNEKYNMSFYFGPNSYNTLKQYNELFSEAYGGNKQLTELIDMGWSWVSWFNKYFVIPVFNFLQNNTNFNYGIIILILTLLVKLLLFPLTYKSYVSQAKMRVLKPQIDKINERIPAEKAMERQQATMKLYNSVGVSPLGGCLPMVIQMPILIALFYFFPGAIELRQQGFLWATDLASYDSIATIPFTIPFYGNHVSLFCLLMTITNIIYTKMNSRNQPQNDQMKGMQTMMMIMPVMFLFIFNSYSAGLSYYYFIATLITIIQTTLIRKFIDDEKILKQLELNKAKPKKKSKFQERLEAMQKAQEKRLREQKK